jgi:hypothetical protein
VTKVAAIDVDVNNLFCFKKKKNLQVMGDNVIMVIWYFDGMALVCVR